MSEIKGLLEFVAAARFVATMKKFRLNGTVRTIKRRPENGRVERKSLNPTKCCTLLNGKITLCSWKKETSGAASWE